MPRTLTFERELLRNFRPLDGWSNFLSLWSQIDTEEEAQSMLHIGIGMPISHRWSETLTDVSERTDFYLTISRHPNKKLATTAQQLVVKRLLPLGQIKDDWVELHMRFLGFLKEPLPSLYNPPYPRFVHEYLVERVLEATFFNGPSPGPKLTKLAPISPELLHPLVAWGFMGVVGNSYYKLSDYQRQGLIKYLSEYLREQGYSPLHAFQHPGVLGADGGYRSRFDPREVKKNANQQAAEAIIRLAGLEDFHNSASGRKAETLLSVLKN